MIAGQKKRPQGMGSRTVKSKRTNNFITVFVADIISHFLQNVKSGAGE